MPSPLPQPLHRLHSIITRKPGMGATPHPARPAPVAAGAQRVEGRNVVADQDHLTAPDTLAGRSDMNSGVSNNVGKWKRYRSAPECGIAKYIYAKRLNQRQN